MIDEATKRKQAYQYVVEQTKKLNWSPPIDSDKRLAETLDIPIDELDSLKVGMTDPSVKLVTAFKSLVSQMVSETEVDSYLVKPFER